MTRIVALWLPLFATDRLTRPGKALADWRDQPLATFGRDGGALRVVAANAPARGAGVVPGLPAADATALCPGLKGVAAEPEAEVAALAALAEWCQRWSPWTAPAVTGLEGDHGVWIEVAGSAHLFGGERALLDDMAARLGGLGFTLRAGLADTPGAAWALARFGAERTGLLPEGAARQLLGAFPVAALRLPPAMVETLRRLGLRRIADLLGLPRAPLAARFGPLVAQRLDQLLGRRPEPLSPRPPAEKPLARLAFAEPIGRDADVAAATLALLADLAGQMERRGLGARRLTLKVFRVDGTVLGQSVGTSRPVRDPAHLARLFAEGRAGLDAGFGIEAMTLAADSADPLVGEQGDIETRPRGTTLPLLLDRLTRRLGEGAVFRPRPLASHWPERRSGRAPPLAPAPAAGWPPAGRPPRLSPPRPVVVSESDGVPSGRAEGPERLAAEWWRGKRGHRDYWRIEDESGRRFWLFRDETGDWFRHGEFP